MKPAYISKDNIIFYSKSKKLYIKIYKSSSNNGIDIDKSQTNKNIVLKDFIKYINDLIIFMDKNKDNKCMYKIIFNSGNNQQGLNFEDLPLSNSQQICFDIGTLVINFCKILNDSENNSANVNSESIEFISWIYTYDFMYSRIFTIIKLDKINCLISIIFEVIKYDCKETNLNYEFNYSYSNDYTCTSVLLEAFNIALNLLQKINLMISYRSELQNKKYYNKNIMDHVSFFIQRNKSELIFKAETYILEKYNKIDTAVREKYESVIKNSRYIKNTILQKIRKLQKLVQNKQGSYYFTGRNTPNSFKIFMQKNDISHLKFNKDKFKIYISSDSLYIYKSLIYTPFKKISNILGSNFCTYIKLDIDKFYIATHNIEYNVDQCKLMYNFNVTNVSHILSDNILKYQNIFYLNKVVFSTTDSKVILNPTFLDDGIFNKVFNEYKYFIYNFTDNYNFTDILSNNIFDKDDDNKWEENFQN